MRKLWACFLVVALFSSNLLAGESAAEKFVRLMKEKKCDQAEQQAKLISKGSLLVYSRGLVAYFCRGDKQTGYALFTQSADMGDSTAKQMLAEIDRRSKEIQASRCDKVYAVDATYSKQIAEIQDVFEQEIEATRSQGLSAFLLGAGGYGSGGEALASGGRASMPYTDRVNRLAFERDSKIREIRYKQNQLRTENRQCFP